MSFIFLIFMLNYCQFANSYNNKFKGSIYSKLVFLMKKVHTKIYYFSDEIIYYLLSYLIKYSRINFESKIVFSNTLVQIGNSPENYLLISVTTLRDFYNLNEVIKLLRSTFRKIKFNIILGGSANNFVNNNDILEYYPEISHICVGKGEEVLKTVIEKKLRRGIYYAKDFDSNKPSVVNKKYRLKNSVFLTFNDLRCSWNKCLFCHQISKSVYPVKSPHELASNVEYYINECGYKNFFFFDNSLNLVLLKEFLEILYQKGYAKHKLNFELFGLRANSQIEVLKGILDRWQPAPIWTGSWGVEFYEQTVLDRYKKGVELLNIDESLDFFHRYKIKNNVYLLFGLPLVTDKQLKSLELFMKKYQDKINEYRINFFLLTKSLRIYAQRSEFGIKEGRYYTLRDYLPQYNLPAIKTTYLDFTSWDEDSQKYISRDETLKKYASLFKYDKMAFEPFLFFIKNKKLLDFLLIKKIFGVTL